MLDDRFEKIKAFTRFVDLSENMDPDVQVVISGIGSKLGNNMRAFLDFQMTQNRKIEFFRSLVDFYRPDLIYCMRGNFDLFVR